MRFTGSSHGYQVTLKVDGRPIAFELDTGAAVTLISEKHMPRNVTLVPLKSMARNYTRRRLDVKGLWAAVDNVDFEVE